MIEENNDKKRADTFRKELPGTIGCVSVYSVAAISACTAFVASPYGVIVALALIAFYVGAIVMFGQGSILEMGLLAVILLVLACQCGMIINGTNNVPAKPKGQQSPDNNTMHTKCRSRAVFSACMFNPGTR